MEELKGYIIANSEKNKISLERFSILMGVYFFKKIYSHNELYFLDSEHKDFIETYIPSQFQKLFVIYQKYIETNYKVFSSDTDSELEHAFEIGLQSFNLVKIQSILFECSDLFKLDKKGTTITIKTAKNRQCKRVEGTDASTPSDNSISSVSSNKNADSTSEETLPDWLINQCETLQKTLKESRGGEIKIPFWENRITPEEYKSLESKIKDKSCYLKGLINNYPYLVGLYVGEWYKRDYTEDDGIDAESENSLDFYPGYARDWWNSMEKQVPDIQQYLVKLQNYLWVRSLYVLGGLPIRWLKSDKLDPFWIYIYNDDADDDTKIKQYLSNSEAFLKSLESGSLRKFINALKSNSESVFSESDEADPDIKTFLDKLRNPLYLVTKQEKFKKEPFLFMYKNESGQNELIYYVKVAFKNFSNAESSNYLSYERLINDLKPSDDFKELPYFSIVVEDEKKQEVTFFNDYHGFFLSRNDSLYVDLSSEGHPSIKIVYPDETKDISKKFNLSNSLLEEGYIQLYKSGSGWVTKESVGATILIYDTEKWELQSKNDTDVIYMGDKTFKKVVIYDSVEISNVKSPKNNKEFLRKWDSLELIPKKSDFIRYYDNDCLNSYYESPLPVLFLNKQRPNSSFTGQRIKDGEKETIKAEDLTIIEPKDLTTNDIIRIENIRFSYDGQEASKKFIIIPFDGDDPILSDSTKHTIECNFEIASVIPPVISDDNKETYRIDIKVEDDMFYQIDVFLPYNNTRLLYKNTPVPDNINIFPELSKSQFTIQTRGSRNSSITQCTDGNRFKKFTELKTIDLDKTYCSEYDFYAINKQKHVKKVSFDKFKNGYRIRQNEDYIVYFQSLSEVKTPMELFKPLIKKNLDDNLFLFKICIAHNLPLCAFFTADMLKNENGSDFKKYYLKLCELLRKLYDNGTGESFIREHKSYLEKFKDYFCELFNKADFWSKFYWNYTKAPVLKELLINLGII